MNDVVSYLCLLSYLCMYDGSLILHAEVLNAVY